MTITSPAAARCQTLPNAQEPREDQADRAEHLGHADEPQEQARQGHLLCQYLDWQGVHST